MWLRLKELLTECWSKALQLNCNYNQQLIKVEENSSSEEQLKCVTGHFLNMRKVAVSPQMGANRMQWSYKRQESVKKLLNL